MNEPDLRWWAGMRGQARFFDIDEQLKQAPAKGEALEWLNALVDFERFRADLGRAVPRSDRSKGRRPPFDHVPMFKTQILQSSHNLSDERTEYLIRDQLSFKRFLGLGLADTVPDANTIWTLRETLTQARTAGEPAVEVLFAVSMRRSQIHCKIPKRKPSRTAPPGPISASRRCVRRSSTSSPRTKDR